MRIHHRPETQEQAHCSSSGKPRSQAAVSPAHEAPDEGVSASAPHTARAVSAVHTPRGASPAAGKTGPGGVQRLGLCSRCTGSAGLWPSAPGGGEPLVLWFSRRKVKCSCFLPWRFEVVPGLTNMSVGY